MAQSVVSTFALIAFMGAGCATDQTRAGKYPPPPSEQVRASIGTLGIVSVGAQTKITITKPMTQGTSAAATAGSAALEGLLSEGAQGGPLGLIIAAVVLVPLGALAGGITGYSEGLPPAELDQSKRELLAAIHSSQLQETLAREILGAARSKTRYRIVMVRDREPGSAGPSTGSESSTNAPIDTTLEIAVLGAGLNGPSKKTAKLSAFVVVRARLVRVRDGAELYSHTRVSQAGSRTFLEWAQNHARALREELARMAKPLAVSIVEELFLNYDPKQSQHPARPLE